MKFFDVAGLAGSQGGEYVLGMKDLHSDACYLIYGRIAAQEAPRMVKPGRGYEEILCAVDGPLTMHTDRGDIRLEKGHAVHLPEETALHISNPTLQPVVYVVAGGSRHPRT